MKLALDDRIIDLIKFIGEKYNDIDKIVIYGSRARGDNRKTSDIDIAVYCKDDSHKGVYANIKVSQKVALC